MPPSCNIFNHSGDLGDIIYSLPTMRDMGGGTLFLTPDSRTREPMTPQRAANIIPLLKSQPYVTDAVYSNEKPEPCHNFNQIRSFLRKLGNGRMSICELHLNTFRRHAEAWKEPWLTVTPSKVAKAVVARSQRYHDRLADYRPYMADAVFIGTEIEWNAFRCIYGDIQWHKTADLLEVAQVIAGAELFIGNQSCPLAIALGLGVNCVVEEWPTDANCRLIRSQSHYRPMR